MQQPPNPYSQYPQQQWEQPPIPPQQTPPQQLPPQSQNNRPWWIGLVILGVIFVSYFLSKSGIQSTTTTTTTTAPTVIASTASAATTVNTPTTFTVGKQVSAGTWKITVNSAKTSTGNEFDTPKSGNIYLLIDFTAKNTDTSNHDMSPIYFTLRDNQGNTYDLAYITVPSDPRGAVVAGQQLRGDLSYEVPKSLHSFILQFDPPTDSDDSQIVQWIIQVQELK